MANRLVVPFALTEGDRRLTVLEKRSFLIILIMAMISCLLFNFRDYVADIVDSRDICSNHTVRKISSISLPKLNLHCEQIFLAKSYYQLNVDPTTTKFTHFYGRHDILVVLDLWIAVVFVIQFILYWKGTIWVYQARREDIHLFSKQDPIRCWFSVAIGCYLLFGAIALVFFWYPTGSTGYSPYNWEPSSSLSWLDMVSNYGVGAFVGTLVPSFLILARSPLLVFGVMIFRNTKV